MIVNDFGNDAQPFVSTDLTTTAPIAPGVALAPAKLIPTELVVSPDTTEAPAGAVQI